MRNSRTIEIHFIHVPLPKVWYPVRIWMLQYYIIFSLRKKRHFTMNTNLSQMCLTHVYVLNTWRAGYTLQTMCLQQTLTNCQTSLHTVNNLRNYNKTKYRGTTLEVLFGIEKMSKKIRRVKLRVIMTLGAFHVRTQESGVMLPTSRGPSGLSGESENQTKNSWSYSNNLNHLHENHTIKTTD